MNAAIVWRGPSELDGSPVVVVVTGLQGSRNSKTGAMVQTYILVDGMSPRDAILSGADRGICGDCPHRGDGKGGKRTCYVSLATGLQQVGRALARNAYLRMSPERMATRLRGRHVRLGTYGDPAAVPVAVWDRLLKRAAGWTGYTHQWRTSPGLKGRCMASVDSPEERERARALGWRTFRVRKVTSTVEPIGSREVVCPASAEAGHRVTCEQCRLCNGVGASGDRLPVKDVAITDHSNSGRAALRRLNVLQGSLSL